MNTLLQKAAPGRTGMVTFHYRNRNGDCMPDQVDDPLDILGDISRLDLSNEELSRLRDILRKDIARRGCEAVWRERTFRKNLILSHGRIL